MNKLDLLGTWKLIKYLTIETLNDEEQIIHPFGEDPMGYLIYTPENYVSVQIMRSNRTKQDSNLGEKMEASENFGGYVGRYEIRDNYVVHYPEISGFLSYIQKPQIREFKLIDNQLILEYVHPVGEHSLLQEKRGMSRSRLIWERVYVNQHCPD